MDCTSCATEIPSGARFCPGCGTPQHREIHETRKTVTIVFCDLSGSTAMSERIDAESLRGVLLRYFELMSSCLVRHGGTVEKYIGDAVMAVFGIPVVHEDDALRAVRAASEMCAAVVTLNEDLVREVGVRIAIRVGVNTGEVVAVDGATGGQALVAGEAVNVAARLEQHSGPGTVLLGHSTYRLVNGAVLADEVPPLTVKGKSEPVRAWRLREVLPGTPPVPRRFDVPLLGRELETSQLALLLSGVRRTRSCHICTVFGDPGIGKTRLVQEFVATVPSGEAYVATGACPAYDAGTLAPFDSVLTGLLGVAGLADLPEAFADVPAAAATLAGVLRDGATGTDAEDAFWAIRVAIEAVARQRTVIVVIDDLQWASPGLLDLLTHLADRLHGVPVMFLCLARVELLDTRPQWGGGQLNTTSMMLRPLAAEDGLRLAAELADVSAHLSAGAVDRVVGAAEGNPFVIEQMMAMIQEDDAGGIPATLQAVIAARLDLLSPAHREWLRWAAVLGAEFTGADVAEVAGEPRLNEDDLHLLVRRHLIEPRGTRRGAAVYRFTSPQIRDVTYAALPKRVRAQRHVRVARAIIAARPAADGEAGTHLESAVRCHTELGPGTPESVALGEEALCRLHGAGRTAHRLGDLPRARALFERALAIPVPGAGPERMRATAELADTLLASGRPADADRLLDRLQEEATRAGERELAAHGRLQQAVLHLGDLGLDHLVETAETTLPLFEAAGDRLGMARCWLRLGQASQAGSRFDEAIGRFERALDLGLRADARVEVATTLGGLALCLWRGPEPTSAAIDRCHALLAESGECPQVTWVAVNCPRAVLLAMRHRHDEGRAILAEAQRILDDLGHVTAGATVPIFAGQLEAAAGDLPAAERAFASARTAFTEIGDPHLIEAATVELARVIHRRGRGDEALDLLASCHRLDDVLLRTEAALAESLRARILTGVPALAAMRRSLALVESLESLQTRATVLLDAAHVLRRDGRAREAVDAARRALDCFRRKEDLVGCDGAEAVLERWRADDAGDR